ncbi:MAG: hypothetical protein J6J21_00195 [Clostridia bacterium]|nr:hypothetical protein [Clostridia bacterium]
MDLPFHKVGLAHLACPLISQFDREEFLRVLSLLPQSELFDIFRRAALLGVGIEINTRDFLFSPQEADVILRLFRIAKECGCQFYLASDAHSPSYFEIAKEAFARAIALLDLTENDKFRLK